MLSRLSLNLNSPASGFEVITTMSSLAPSRYSLWKNWGFVKWSVCLLGPCELGKLGQHSWGKFLNKRIKGKQGPGVCVSLIVTGAGVTWDVMFPFFPLLVKCGTWNMVKESSQLFTFLLWPRTWEEGNITKSTFTLLLELLLVLETLSSRFVVFSIDTCHSGCQP